MLFRIHSAAPRRTVNGRRVETSLRYVSAGSIFAHQKTCLWPGKQIPPSGRNDKGLGNDKGMSEMPKGWSKREGPDFSRATENIDSERLSGRGNF